MLMRAIMNDKQAAEFEATKECNFAISPTGIGRFRVSAFVQQGKVGIVLRIIADHIPNAEELHLPTLVNDLSMAKRGIVMTQGTAPASAVAGIDRLGRLVRTALKDVLDAFAHGDVAKARDVWQRDEEIDQVYTGLFRELLTYMMEDPRTITACTHLLFMAKNIERAGDHVTNIAELVSFRTTGHGFDEARPKGSASLYAAGNVP